MTAIMSTILITGALTGCSSDTSSTSSSTTSNNSSTSSDTTSSTTADETTAPATETVELSPAGYPISSTQELVFNLGVDPLSLDPQLNTAIDGGYVLNNTFEGLVREIDGELTPAMAESWTVSDDGLVYTFTLRDNLKWSDGQDLVAGDFEYAWKRAMNPETAGKYRNLFVSANMLNAVEIVADEVSYDELGVKALDDKTLEVTLTNPCEFFLRLIIANSFLPVREDIVDVEGVWAKNPETAVSNGPFVLSEYSMGDQLVLTKNEHYWNADNVMLDTVVCKMIVDASTALTAFNADEIHMSGVIPADEIPVLIAESTEMHILPNIGTYYLAMNLENEIFDDVNVRKALSLAIDRELFVEQVTRSGETVATGFIGPGFLDANGDEFMDVAGNYGISKNADIEAAQQALADAGYPNGEGFPTLEYLYNTNETHKKAAEAFQEMWKQNLGIEVELVNQEWGVFLETRTLGDYEIARNGYIGDYTDPNTLLEIFLSDHGQNTIRFYNDDYDEAMANARVTTGQERMEYLYEAQDILMEDYSIIPIYHYVYTWLVADEVEGWEIAPNGRPWLGDVVIVDVN
ncbi:MAG: ABC transporter substrate-binding protein [Epulopiscium sp. Nele67-Bin004]|nr:MAG: ABC transporter substrate-binding protein [Epulopiscium sp. Nele67-Bin004]